ncbi:hypothetical protein [Cohnella sp. 56]|uniref:hypothetical protein n=1 Tax=Cohnella sp. 56 TaxID=3113722 RepID=UPI0030E790DE
MLIQDHTAYKIWESTIKEHERKWAFERQHRETKRPRADLPATWLALILASTLRMY